MAAVEAMMVNVANMFNLERPTTAMEDIPEAMVEETTLEQPMSIASAQALVSPLQTTPTYEAPAPAAMNMLENMTDTPPALSLIRSFAITESGSKSNPLSLGISPHVSQKPEKLSFHPYKRVECHHRDGDVTGRRISLQAVGPAGSGSTTPFSQSDNGETSAIAPPFQTVIEPDRDFISRFYDEDSSGMRTFGAKF
jgi:hypothetical protein